MKIKRILSQHRRDFNAIFVCEHCDKEIERTGYDDTYFHTKVIPDMDCPECNKKADKNYKPRGTKYPDGKVV